MVVRVINIGHIDKPEPKRDRWGRYLIAPAPNTEPIGHTRATTVAKTLEDTRLLTKWEKRMVAKGVATRKDLIALAASHDPTNDRKVMDDVADRAMEIAQSSAAASIGTSLHKFTENLDSGTITQNDIPDEWAEQTALYTQTLKNANITIHREWIEQILIDDTYKVAGTADRIVTLPDGRRMIADLKTAKKTLDYSWLSISIQMAMYANHTARWDTATNSRQSRIDVDLEHALIIHLPSLGGPCTLHLVDITAGYNNYLTALEVREIRKTAKKVATVFTPIAFSSDPPKPAATAKPDKGMATIVTETFVTKPAAATVEGQTGLRGWIARRMKQLTPEAVKTLRQYWPGDVPIPLPETLTETQADSMDNVLSKVEANHGIPFGEARPGTTATLDFMTHRI